MTSQGVAPPVSDPRHAAMRALQGAPVYTSLEVALALGIACLVEASFFLLLAIAGMTAAEIKPASEPAPIERPISVKPVLDDAPLLKLGGKKVRAKLPDMWKKQAAIKRYEERSAPSPFAEKTPEAIPTSALASPDSEAPPPDADLAKKVDEDIELLDAATKEPTVEGEGVQDGVKEGTETDPLKGRAVSLYRAKLIAWFKAPFSIPPGAIPCEQLTKLKSRVSASVSPDGTVTGFSVGSPSGNGTFDGRVQSAMQSRVGQQVPPPPPLYPDILPPNLSLDFSSPKCE